jgi:hypothetical protein
MPPPQTACDAPAGVGLIPAQLIIVEHLVGDERPTVPDVSEG